jgi:hypothetical protein
MKNESGLHFLGWVILAHLTGGWLAIGCVLIASVYSVLSLIEMYRSKP